MLNYKSSSCTSVWIYLDFFKLYNRNLNFNNFFVKKFFPPEWLTLLSGFLHTHLAGRRFFLDLKYTCFILKNIQILNLDESKLSSSFLFYQNWIKSFKKDVQIELKFWFWYILCKIRSYTSIQNYRFEALSVRKI